MTTTLFDLPIVTAQPATFADRVATLPPALGAAVTDAVAEDAELVFGITHGSGPVERVDEVPVRRGELDPGPDGGHGTPRVRGQGADRPEARVDLDGVDRPRSLRIRPVDDRAGRDRDAGLGQGDQFAAGVAE